LSAGSGKRERQLLFIEVRLKKESKLSPPNVYFCTIPMRTVASILSFLILSLSIIPCSDAETCEEEKAGGVETSHDHSEDEDDNCSPFCVCGCCGNTYVVQEVTHGFSHIATAFHSSVFSYSFLYSFDYLDAIWQPPKFC
jgi:hypothetical protein